MSEWKARRFWTDAAVVIDGDAYAVRLDGRPVRTPAKGLLRVPSPGLAEGIADEWRAQGEVVDPLTMPLTRAANATLDKVMPQLGAVVDELSGYGASDLLCYRAGRPAGLVERQAAAWDPLLDWADDRFGARLAVTRGVMPAPQPANALEALRARVAEMDAWTLTALSEFVTLSGSLVIGLAAAERAWPIDALWSASRIDEDWQIAEWGDDAEAAERTALRREAFLQADRLLRSLDVG